MGIPKDFLPLKAFWFEVTVKLLETLISLPNSRVEFGIKNFFLNFIIFCPFVVFRALKGFILDKLQNVEFKECLLLCMELFMIRDLSVN